MAYYDDCLPDCKVSPSHMDVHLEGCGFQKIRTPMTTPAQKPPIVECAESFSGGAPVNDLAILLMKTWGKVDPSSNVSLFPASYIANFADMARAVIEAQTSRRDELANALGPWYSFVAEDGYRSSTTYSGPELADIALKTLGVTDA